MQDYAGVRDPRTSGRRRKRELIGDDYIYQGNISGQNMWPWAVSIKMKMEFRENHFNDVQPINGRKHFD